MSHDDIQRLRQMCNNVNRGTFWGRVLHGYNNGRGFADDQLVMFVRIAHRISHHVTTLSNYLDGNGCDPSLRFRVSEYIKQMIWTLIDSKLNNKRVQKQLLTFIKSRNVSWIACVVYRQTSINVSSHQTSPVVVDSSSAYITVPIIHNIPATATTPAITHHRIVRIAVHNTGTAINIQKHTQ